MIQIQAKPRQTIPLGHRGENEAREIIFDLTEYISTYGPGTARLLHQRKDDPAPYIVPAVQSDSTMTWTVTDADTAAPGTGSAELQWTVNNVLAKSDIWNTKTKAALDDGATAPPTGAEGWYQRLIAYIDSLKGDGVTDDQIAAAVDAYLAENPVDVPVQSVNGKTGAVQLTAHDVGALAQDDLQTGVDTALAQAKASGEFDGQAGDDGGYYTPSVDAGGNLLWAASKEDMPAVAGANIKGPPGTTGKSAYQYAVEGGYTGTETEFAAKLAVENIPAPATAEVGQTIVVKAVDAEGKPTEWEAADMDGGEKAWKYEKYVEFSEETAGFEFTAYDDGKPFDFTEIDVLVALKNAATTNVWGDLSITHDGIDKNNESGARLALGGTNSSVSITVSTGKFYLCRIKGYIDTGIGVYGDITRKSADMYTNLGAYNNMDIIRNIPNYAFGTNADLKGWTKLPTKFTKVYSNMTIGAGSSILIRGR